jgi:hypothetical protein
MARSITVVIICGIALTVSNLPAQSARTEPVAGMDRQAMTRESCIASGAAGRVRCPRIPVSGAEGRDERCEDAINLQQRVCMLEALEALHPKALERKPIPMTAEQPR